MPFLPYCGYGITHRQCCPKQKAWLRFCNELNQLEDFQASSSHSVILTSYSSTSVFHLLGVTNTYTSINERTFESSEVLPLEEVIGVCVGPQLISTRENCYARESLALGPFRSFVSHRMLARPCVGSLTCAICHGMMQPKDFLAELVPCCLGLGFLNCGLDKPFSFRVASFVPFVLAMGHRFVFLEDVPPHTVVFLVQPTRAELMLPQEKGTRVPTQLTTNSTSMCVPTSFLTAQQSLFF